MIDKGTPITARGLGWVCNVHDGRRFSCNPECQLKEGCIARQMVEYVGRRRLARYNKTGVEDADIVEHAAQELFTPLHAEDGHALQRPECEA